MKRIVLVFLLLTAGAVPATPGRGRALGVTRRRGVAHQRGQGPLRHVRGKRRPLPVPAPVPLHSAGSTAEPVNHGYQTIVSGLYMTSNMCDPNGKVGALMAAYGAAPGHRPHLRPAPSRRFASRAAWHFSNEITGAILPLDVDVTWSATSDPLRFSGGQQFPRPPLRLHRARHRVLPGGDLCGEGGRPDRRLVPALQAAVQRHWRRAGRRRDRRCRVPRRGRGTRQPGGGRQRANRFAVGAHRLLRGILRARSPRRAPSHGKLSPVDPDGCHRTELFLVLSDQTVQDGGQPVEQRDGRDRLHR